MKLEFEVTRREAFLLLDGLKYLRQQTNNQETLKALTKIIREIIRDGNLEIEVFKLLVKVLKNDSTPGVKFELDSSLRNDLDISPTFINSVHGLRSDCNLVLEYIVNKHKPGKTPGSVSIQKTRKCETIQDVINLMVDKYESI